MASIEDFDCPVSGCAETGTLSQIIHHVSESDDTSHRWEVLGYDNSYAFRVAQEERDQTDIESGESETYSRDPPLEAVPAIGDTRADALRDAGYDSAAAVAQTAVDDLAAVETMSEPTAECIRLTAREACGFPQTFISKLAASLGADRSVVADAYGTLAATVVTPSEAEETLRLRFSDAENSILSLDGCSIRYLHYLYQAGFEEIGDVSKASVSELTNAPYVGETRAEAIRERARRALSADLSTGESPDSQTETPEPSSSGSDNHSSPSKSSAAPSTEVGTFPPAMQKREQWLLWKETDDGRKVPRAPWKTGDPLEFVSAMESDNWTSFEEAVQWQEKLPHEMELAFALTRDDAFVFFDLDDVVVDGSLTDAAQELVDTAETYAARSTSGTGIHLYGTGELSTGVKSLTGPLVDNSDQSLEVYDRNRFVAMTGDHLEPTPTTATAVEGLLSDLENEFTTVHSSTPDRATPEPRRSREQLESIETTNDIRDVFDAIRQTTPSDISMRSTQTKAHGDGTYSYDPSWVHSESGTRLGVTDDGWIYRKGMIALDALQIVALEEGLLSDERSYPEGETFWEAVEALRNRGAHIPQYEPETTPTTDEAATDPEFSIDEREVAKRLNYGQKVRTYVSRYDRDYQERLALQLAPVFVEAAESLYLSPAVVYRAAEVYAAGHAAGVVGGAAHEATIAAALRIASIEADHPRPLETLAEELDTNPTTIRTKLRRLLDETAITDAIDAADLVAEPADYISHLARQLDVHDDDTVVSEVQGLLDSVDVHGGTNPMSEVGAAFYVVLKKSTEYRHTQQTVAEAANVSTMTIRQNYQKYADQS